VDIDDITKAWDEVGRTDNAQRAIHPTGGMTPADYEASGRAQAQQVSELMWTYCIPHVPGEPRVADFGCGDGRVLKYVAEEFSDSWGVDASSAMLEKLVDRVPGVMTVQSDGTDGELDDLGADFIYSLAVFIHHDIDGGRRLIRGLANAVNPGGFLALQIPCYEIARERSAWNDVTVWTPNQLLSAMKVAGLQPVEVHTSPGEFSFSNVGEHHHRMQVFRKGA
jgi:trans-aconitate methyltransferase